MSTPIPLWMALAIFFAAVAFSSAQEWFSGQYEVTRKGWHPAITRRWYGTHAHVRLRDGWGSAKANVFRVIRWDDEDAELPWLLVVLHSGTSWSASGEGPQPFWGRVTDFAPYTVRRVRPHILRTERRRFPELFDYRPVRQPSGYLGEAA